MTPDEIIGMAHALETPVAMRAAASAMAEHFLRMALRNMPTLVLSNGQCLAFIAGSILSARVCGKSAFAEFLDRLSPWVKREGSAALLAMARGEFPPD